MHPSIGIYLILATVGCVHAYPALEERAACNKDNLLNAFSSPAHTAQASSFCSAYISIPATSTVTTYTDTCTHLTTKGVVVSIHPLYLYNLQTLKETDTPISYNSASPTPVLVPDGNAQLYAGKKHKRQDFTLLKEHPEEQHEVLLDHSKYSGPLQDNPVEAVITPLPTLPIHDEALLKRASTVPLPSWLATTYPPSRISSACSCISPSAAYTKTITTTKYTEVTTTTCDVYSAFPEATYPAFCGPIYQHNAPQPLSQPGYRVSSTFSTASKMDCCAACTNHFNCAWWKFDFGTPGDGWKPGQCHFAYYIGPFTDAVGGPYPAVCPNGATQGINNTYLAYKGDELSNNRPGYELGPCGNALNLYQSTDDAGFPTHFDDGCSSAERPRYEGTCG